VEGIVLVTEIFCKFTLVGYNTDCNNEKGSVLKGVGKMVTFTENGG